MSEVAANRPRQLLSEPLAWLRSFGKFSRPHTIIGTSLSVLALYLLVIAIGANAVKGDNLVQFLGVWLACLGGNIYIVGLNQLEDIAIDKINKPYLPLAAGEFSRRQGQWIVALAGIGALAISGYLGFWAFATVAISLMLGTAYSLPPTRLKRFPFWAAFCIFTVRGVIVNLGLFLHFSEKISGEVFLPAAVWALTGFIVVFTVAIAIFKDVPDLEGDRQFQIVTFTLLLGKPAVFNLSRWLITIAYLGIIAIGVSWLPNIERNFLLISHLFLLALLWWRSQQVDLADKKAIAAFYQFIWQLFFWEYLLYPAAYLLA